MQIARILRAIGAFARCDLDKGNRAAGWILRQIQNLYRIERALRESRRGGTGPKLRQAVRAHQSRPIVERIKKAIVILKASGRHLPQSLFGQAIDYALGQWTTLEVFLRQGRVEIDNNLVENAIRPTAIGKNYAQLSVMRRCRA